MVVTTTYIADLWKNKTTPCVCVCGCVCMAHVNIMVDRANVSIKNNKQTNKTEEKKTSTTTKTQQEEEQNNNNISKISNKLFKPSHQ